MKNGYRSHTQAGRQAAAMLTAAVCVAACGSTGSAAGSVSTPRPDPSTVSLGYLVNLTHAPALIGTSAGYLQSALPAGTTLKATTFTAGPAESEALLGGTLDAAFVGPSPAINAFIKTSGKVIVVAGVASGGAGLVVSQALAGGNFPSDLASQTVATPQLGNTQDVALRSWLASKGLSTSITGGGAVNIDSTSGNSVSLQHFEAGQISGGWVPEPYESQFVITGHGKLVVDEASLWPGGQFPTTLLVVTKTLLTQHPDIVTDLLKGLVKTVNWIQQNQSSAPGIANAALASVTGSKPLSAGVLALAWSHLTFTLDPLAADLQIDANRAKALGLITSSDITGIVNLAPLNAIRGAAGDPAFSSGGLGS
jgi:NitT/TauT family transport system substrate-binding protein